MSVDIIEKVGRLAEDGDPAAHGVAEKVRRVRESKMDVSSLKVIQEVERSILDVARQLELIDSIGHRDLERLREDRHLCAHPSLRPLGEFYEPRIETARAHISAALSLLLIHPPSQGQRAVERFLQHVTDSSFSGAASYLSHTFFDSVREAARRRIVNVSIKHAALELDGASPTLTASEIADRMGLCVAVFAESDRTLVRDEMRKTRERLTACSGDVQKRATARLGSLDVFWDALEAPFREQINSMIGAIVLPNRYHYERLATDDTRLLALVGSDVARSNAGELERVFEKQDVIDRATIIGSCPSPYFASHIAGLLRDARGWRSAEFITQTAVLPCARFLDMQQLCLSLSAWAENDQCRTAGGMLSLIDELFVLTKHLRAIDETAWRNFLQAVQRLEVVGSPYRYEELEQRVNAEYSKSI
ncbi:MAG: hypothetical protein M3332_07605 [Actinomycetota bacterium]|nr:hypothetical protein [Actinomycetota bacterium]